MRPSFKKTCLLEGVTSQWRYERGKSRRERGREVKEERRGEKVREQKGKMGGMEREAANGDWW